MIFEATEELLDADDDGSIDPDILRRRFAVAVEACWREGMTLDDLVAAARIKLALPN